MCGHIHMPPKPVLVSTVMIVKKRNGITKNRKWPKNKKTTVRPLFVRGLSFVIRGLVHAVIENMGEDFLILMC